MNIKTITYQRVLNLGNYESKRLEMTAEIEAHLEFAEDECTVLMEFVERKIREDAALKIALEIDAARTKLRGIQREIALINEGGDF